jgi:hypothetical protein
VKSLEIIVELWLGEGNELICGVGWGLSVDAVLLPGLSVGELSDMEFDEYRI